MSSNLSLSPLPVQTLPAHIDALHSLLPPRGAVKVHRNLLFRLQDLSRALAPAGIADQRSQFLVWNRCKTGGLIPLLCDAAIRTAELDSEGLIIAELAGCLGVIVNAGIAGGWHPSRDSKEDEEIVHSLTAVTTAVLDKAWLRLRRNIVSWKQQWPRFCGPIANIVRFACSVNRLIEYVLPGSTTESTELDSPPDTLQLLQQEMKRSAHIEELLLQFIAHADSSPDRYGDLLMNTMSSFSGIFQGCLAPLDKVPTGLDNLGVVFRDLIMDVEEGKRNAVDCARYSSTVAIISILLARPDFVSCFQAGESRALRDKSRDLRQSMKGRKMMGGELCTVVCVDYWLWIKHENNPLIGKVELDVVTIRALLAACYLLSVPTFVPVISMLLPQGVFVPLLARALVAWQRLGDNGQIAAFGTSNWTEDIRKYLFLACGGNVIPMILDSTIERSSGFLDIIDILETTKTLNHHSPTDKPMALWKDFCAIGKLHEKESWEKEREERKARLGGQVGWTGKNDTNSDAIRHNPPHNKRMPTPPQSPGNPST
ncbi:hypothetical protein M407DRAFT_24847 [Tulasnella calospora MUT 4182]|uniref:Uncharacterized protein n=1 Tax=Tulasnella calospora MUT 4182 TaxID=1051891 RepID=A0A0C3QII9_9AGAM|nr:hypothetical protein M407DRAFT_24847 [Tulasnella calospora MUT 4182]